MYVRNAAIHGEFFQAWTGENGYGGLGFKWNGTGHGGHDKNIDVHAFNNSGNWHKVGYIENSYGTSQTGYSSGGRFQDFTGQHRCLTNNKLDESMYGLIVSSTGKYVNINNDIRATMNESLPICEITNKNNDRKIFGVISDDADDNEERTTGNGTFKSIELKTNRNEKRLHINSVGEGSIWVCNINGNIENGEYITSSTVSGYGQLQNDDLLHNYTVAKITCDCNFSLTKIVKQKLKTIKVMVEEVREKISDNEEDSTEETVQVEKQEIVYDDNGDVQYEDDLDENGQQQMVYEHETRFLDATGNQLDESDYNTRKTNGEDVYIAAFVGCTYHCG